MIKLTKTPDVGLTLIIWAILNI